MLNENDSYHLHQSPYLRDTQCLQPRHLQLFPLQTPLSSAPGVGIIPLEETKYIQNGNVISQIVFKVIKILQRYHSPSAFSIFFLLCHFPVVFVLFLCKILKQINSFLCITNSLSVFSFNIFLCIHVYESQSRS